MAGDVATICFEELADPHVGQIMRGYVRVEDLTVNGKRCTFYHRREYAQQEEPVAPCWWVALHIVNTLISSEESSVARSRLPSPSGPIKPKKRMITVRDKCDRLQHTAWQGRWWDRSNIKRGRL
jgi:hypothetical protein